MPIFTCQKVLIGFVNWQMWGWMRLSRVKQSVSTITTTPRKLATPLNRSTCCLLSSKFSAADSSTSQIPRCLTSPSFPIHNGASPCEIAMDGEVHLLWSAKCTLPHCWTVTSKLQGVWVWKTQNSECSHSDAKCDTLPFLNARKLLMSTWNRYFSDYSTTGTIKFNAIVSTKVEVDGTAETNTANTTQSFKSIYNLKMLAHTENSISHTLQHQWRSDADYFRVVQQY